MPIDVKCGGCGYQFRVRDELAGKRGKCPKCHGLLEVPGGIATAVHATPPPAPTDSFSKASIPTASISNASNSTTSIPRASNSDAPIPEARIASSATPVARAATIPSATPVPRAATPAATPVAKAAAAPAVPSIDTHEPATVAGRRSRRGRGRKKQAMPAWGWVVLVGGALSAAGGWVYYAVNNPAKPVAGAPAEKPGADGAASTPAATPDAPSNEKAAGSDDDTAEEGGKATEPADGEEKDTTADADAAKTAGPAPEDAPMDAATSDDATSDDTAGDDTAAAPAGDTSPAPAAVAGKQEVTPAALVALLEACAEFDWQPESADQYDQLVDVARLMSAAGGEFAPLELGDAVEEAKSQIGLVDWTDGRLAALNDQAAKAVERRASHLIFLGEVLSNYTVNDKDALLVKLDGTDAEVLIEVGTEYGFTAPGKRWIVVAEDKRFPVSFRDRAKPVPLFAPTWLMDMPEKK